MYTKAVALNPAYADAYHNAGLTLQELACYEEANELYRQISTRNTDGMFRGGLTHGTFRGH